MIDYHDQKWPAQVRAITANRGVDAAANAEPGGAARAIEAVAASYRLADAAQALALVAGGHAGGAVVLTP